MPEIAYNQENAGICLCYDCPVQTKSTCAQGKYAPISATVGTVDPPAAADLPGLYCASGVAACDDLDFSKTCQCMVCTVYDDNALARSKYCEEGSASKVG
jgi:hypothetical protein